MKALSALSIVSIIWITIAISTLRIEVTGTDMIMLLGCFVTIRFPTRLTRNISYVASHEISHALAALFSGFKLEKFLISPNGGETVVNIPKNTNSIIIDIAPYMMPVIPVLCASILIFGYNPALILILIISLTHHWAWLIYTLKTNTQDNSDLEGTKKYKTVALVLCVIISIAFSMISLASTSRSASQSIWVLFGLALSSYYLFRKIVFAEDHTQDPNVVPIEFECKIEQNSRQFRYDETITTNTSEPKTITICSLSKKSNFKIIYYSLTQKGDCLNSASVKIVVANAEGQERVMVDATLAKEKNIAPQFVFDPNLSMTGINEEQYLQIIISPDRPAKTEWSVFLEGKETFIGRGD